MPTQPSRIGPHERREDRRSADSTGSACPTTLPTRDAGVVDPRGVHHRHRQADRTGEPVARSERPTVQRSRRQTGGVRYADPTVCHHLCGIGGRDRQHPRDGARAEHRHCSVRHQQCERPVQQEHPGHRSQRHDNQRSSELTGSAAGAREAPSSRFRAHPHRPPGPREPTGEPRRDRRHQHDQQRAVPRRPVGELHHRRHSRRGQHGSRQAAAHADDQRQIHERDVVPLHPRFAMRSHRPSSTTSSAASASAGLCVAMITAAPSPVAAAIFAATHS